MSVCSDVDGQPLKPSAVAAMTDDDQLGVRVRREHPRPGLDQRVYAFVAVVGLEPGNREHTPGHGRGPTRGKLWGQSMRNDGGLAIEFCPTGDLPGGESAGREHEVGVA